MFDLTGRRALVTGSSRGIGRDIAIGLASQGADVCIHYAGAAEDAETVAAKIKATGRHSCIVQGDLTNIDAPRAIVTDAAYGLGGSIDLLVVNAAIQIPQPLEEIDAETARRQFDANVLGTLALIQTVVPDMQREGFGRIIHIGSVQQWRPHPNMLVYAGLKSGIENMMRNLAVRLAPQGITVNSVSPGAIETERNRVALSDAPYRANVEGKIPAGRIGSPKDCVGAVVMLCSDAADYVTGVDVPVDGGMRLG